MQIRPVVTELFHADGQTDVKLIDSFRMFVHCLKPHREMPRALSTVRLAGCTPASVGESKVWHRTVDRVHLGNTLRGH
jgi:hypothetical protein